MKKRNIIIIISIIVLMIIGISILIFNKPKEMDENMLYKKQFGNIVLKFERYDYVLGQRMLVGVEKSTDKGKTYNLVTQEAITVSNEAQFLFMNESLGFVISMGYVTRSNDFIGFKVTNDGGKTFQDAKFNYENDRIDLITIDDFPYYEENILKLKCSVYDVKPEEDGYQDVEIIFSSHDNGLTWNYEK